MRVSVDIEGAPHLSMVLVGSAALNSPSIRGDYCVLEEMPKGLEGWFEPADLQSVDVSALPQQHGTFWPESLWQSSRKLTIRGWHYASPSESSSVSAAEFRDKLAALVGTVGTVTVEDSSGVRTVTGYFPVNPVITHTDTFLTDFSLIMTCPDPLKYGPPAQYSGTGPIVVENSGTGDVPFTVSASQRVTTLTVSCGGRTLEWTGNSLGLVLDTADGRPLSPSGVEVGYLVQADPVRIPPGSQTVQVTANVPVTLTVRSGWK